MAHQPNPKQEPNIVEGIKAIRKMHIRALKESHLPAADEMLYPNNYAYLEDVLSYVAVGARSVENQQHRLTCSGLDVPVGMKNPISGDFDVMFNAVQASQAPHVFGYNGWEVKTSGNPLTHCVLRGAMNMFGQSIPNYHYEDLIRVAKAYKERAFANPAIIVDTNHANSNKQYKEQPRIAKEVMRTREHSEPRAEDGEGLHDRELHRRRLAEGLGKRVRQVHHRPVPGLEGLGEAHSRPGRDGVVPDGIRITAKSLSQQD